MNVLPQILQLDAAGNPQKWINFDKAAYYYTKGLIAWSMQAEEFMLHGGTSRLTGEQSTLTIDTIIAVKGKINAKQLKRINHVPLTNRTLFGRDRNICAYCGNSFSHHFLSRDHIIPSSKGGPNTWMNVVTACHNCNKHKDDRTPEQAGMQLLYVPYVPNKAEYLILRNHKILANQMEFLLARIPAESRLHLI